MKSKIVLSIALSMSLLLSNAISVKADIINEENLGVVYVYNESSNGKTNIATLEATGNLIYRIIVKCPNADKKYKFVGYNPDGSEYYSVDDLDSTFAIRDIDLDKGTYQFYVMESGATSTPNKEETTSNPNVEEDDDDDDDEDDGDSIDDLIKQYSSNSSKVHVMSTRSIAGVGGVYKVKVLAYNSNDVEFNYKYGNGDKMVQGTSSDTNPTLTPNRNPNTESTNSNTSHPNIESPVNASSNQYESPEPNSTSYSDTSKVQKKKKKKSIVKKTKKAKKQIKKKVQKITKKKRKK